MAILDTIKLHYPVFHTFDLEPICFKFFPYFSDLLHDKWLWALQAEDGRIEVYDCQGLLVNLI